MTMHVVDASVFGPLLFEDERGDLYSELDELIADGRCIVPQHWRMEVTNQLLVGLRRGRTTPVAAEGSLQDLDLLPIVVDASTADQLSLIFDLALQHRLTIYDAAYLELAMREDLPLITYDQELRRAAELEAIPVLPVS